jgi:autotransporter-associated beta strand protein
MPATFTWTGLGGDTSWNNPGNWDQQQVPAGDGSNILLFPTLASSLSNHVNNDLPGSAQTPPSFQVITFSGTYDVTGNAFQASIVNVNIPSSDSVTIENSQITGATTLLLAGTGEVVLRASNSYTGSTDLFGGTLDVESDNALGTGQLIVEQSTNPQPTISSSFGAEISNSVTFETNLTLTGSLNFSGPILLDHFYPTLTLNNDVSFQGTVSDTRASDGMSSGMFVTGIGTLFLTGANTYSGVTYLYQDGRVAVGNDQALGSGPLAFFGSRAAVEAVQGPGEPAGTTRHISNLVDLLGNCTIEGSQNISFDSTTPCNLSMNTTLTVNNTGLTIFSHSITDSASGASTLIKSGLGSLELDGADTYAGGTVLNAGTLLVGNSGALGTGTLIVNGGTIGAAGASAVAIGNRVSIFGDFAVAGSQALAMGGEVDIMGGNSSNGVTITDSGSQGITFAGPVVNFFAGSSFTNLFINAVNPGVAATFSAPIVEQTATLHVSLFKLGQGSLILLAANNYSGSTYLFAGVLSVGNDNSLGTGPLSLDGGTIAAPAGATRTVSNIVTIANDTTFGVPDGSSGNLRFTATTNLVTANHAIIVNARTDFVGPITDQGHGLGLTINSPNQSPLLLETNNTFSGGLTLNSGELDLFNNGSAGTGRLTLNGGAINALEALPNTPAVIANPVTIGGDLSILGSANVTFSGPGTITSTHTLTIPQGEVVTFAGNFVQSIGGRIIQDSGTIVFTGDASQISTILLEGTETGGPSGNGNIGFFNSTGGHVGQQANPGIFAVGGATLSPDSDFVANLTSTTPGSGYNQLRITNGGEVEISGAFLRLSLNFASAVGDSFTIIDNQVETRFGRPNPVLGTFNGLPEGSLITSNGATFYLSYVGGDGNDVVLTHISANQRYVYALYEHALGRAPSMAEMNAWVDFLAGAGRQPVAAGIEHSFEARDRLVRSWYVQYLGRPAQNFEEEGLVTFLMSGGTEEQALAGILGSAEYFAHAPAVISMSGTPASDQTFVIALYEQVLGRPAALVTPGEVQGWVNTLATESRADVALQFLSGPSGAEYRANVILGYYSTVLNRHTPPLPVELFGWVFSSLDLGSIRVQFETSDEFFVNG